MAKQLPVKSADRALDILELIAAAARPPSFSEIAQRLDIPKSSLHGLIGTLTGRGYIEQDRAGEGYRLGPAVDTFARSSPKAESVLRRVRPVLVEISAALNETSGYYERRGDDVECLAAEPGRHHRLQFNMRPGERVPLYANSCGKALLAQLSTEEFEEYLARTELKPFTAATLISRSALRKDIRRVRDTGFAVSRGEFLAGTIAVAVAVVDGNAAVGGIDVVLPEARYDGSIVMRIQYELTRALRRVGSEDGVGRSTG